MPQAFMKKVWQKEYPQLSAQMPEQLIVGQVFFPKARKLDAEIEMRMQDVLAKHDFTVLAWRPVPINTACIESEEIRRHLPCFRQVLLADTPAKANGTAQSVRDLERRLFVARRHIEYEIANKTALTPYDFHIVSLSSQTIIYKGLIHGGKQIFMLIC